VGAFGGMIAAIIFNWISKDDDLKVRCKRRNGTIIVSPDYCKAGLHFEYFTVAPIVAGNVAVLYYAIRALMFYLVKPHLVGRPKRRSNRVSFRG